MQIPMQVLIRIQGFDDQKYGTVFIHGSVDLVSPPACPSVEDAE